jgi:hypothetical protein
MVRAAQAGELRRGFVRFEAAVTEERLAREREAVQPLGQLDLRLGVKRVADVPELFRLFRRGGDEGGMAMPQDRAAEAGEEVEVTLAVGVPKHRAFAALHDDGKAGVIADQDLLAAVEDLLGVEFGSIGHRRDNIAESRRAFPLALFAGRGDRSGQPRACGTSYAHGTAAPLRHPGHGQHRPAVHIGSRRLQALRDRCDRVTDT